VPLLTELQDRRLFPGDILRLSDNYDTGPGSGPVDLLVTHLREEDSGYSLVVASGYKAGLILHTFPLNSMHRSGGGLSVRWLIDHWNDWFVYTDHPKRRIPVEKALVLRKEARSLPQET